MMVAALITIAFGALIIAPLMLGGQSFVAFVIGWSAFCAIPVVLRRRKSFANSEIEK